MKGNDILDVCRRLKQITDELAAMVDEEIKRREGGDTDDDGEDGAELQGSKRPDFEKSITLPAPISSL